MGVLKYTHIIFVQYYIILVVSNIYIFEMCTVVFTYQCDISMDV